MGIDIVGLLILLVVLALCGWLFSTYILPRLPEPFRTVIVVLLVVLLIVALLGYVGIGPGLNVH